MTPNIDLEQARQFLTVLGCNNNTRFRTFDDSKSGKVIPTCHPSEGFELLSDANAKGAGVFVIVNEATGDQDKHVIRVRSFFVDLDGAPLEPVTDCSLTPHAVIESSPGRYHAYWKVKDCPLDKFKSIQQAIAARFNGDKSVVNLSRVMRLPGFMHQKAAPFMTRIISINDRESYTVQEIVDGLQLSGFFNHEQHKTKQQKMSIGNRTGDDFNQKSTWSEVLTPHGWTLKNITNDGRELWNKPGHTGQQSATVNYAGSDLLYCFSDSAGLPVNEGLSKFAVYTYLQHGGDFSIAAKELAKMGYGQASQNGSVPSTSFPDVKVMSDLLDTTFEPIRWVVRGLLPEGLGILSGPPKIGKSWLVMNLCIATSTGGFALGKFKVEPGEVLLLSLEDNERRLKGRLEKCMDGSTPDISRFHATTTWKRLDQGGMSDLSDWLDQHPGCNLVVIDTIQKIKPHPKRKNGTAYENDYDAYGDLQRLALQYRCSILVIHHNRKSDSKNDDDPLEQISGSIGITGAMDTILMLKRPRGTTGAVLMATGRDISEAQYGMLFDCALGQWTVTGKAKEMQLSGNSQIIIDLLKKNEADSFNAQEIFDKLGGEIPFDTLKTQLYRLRNKGIVTADKGRFTYNNTVTDATSANDATSEVAGSRSNTYNEDLEIPDFDF